MQQKQPIISLVIPCYNESKRLVHLKEGLLEFCDVWKSSFECIAVDDGSKDNTAEAVMNLFNEIFKGKSVEYNVIRLAQNEGKGGALRAGVLTAKGDFILTLDADMAARPSALVNWLALLPNHQFSKDEIFIASRNHAQSDTAAKGHRKLAGSIFNLLVRLVTPIQLADTQCGFKLYPNKIAHLLFKDLEIRGWAHDIELLYKAGYLKIPVKSMPIEWNHIDDEKISVLSDGINMAIQTLKLSFKYHFLRPSRIKLKEIQKEFEAIN